MRYPVKFEHDETGWAVFFPDIPEAMTGGETREEALELAQDALVTAFDFYFDDRREIPAPSADGEAFVEVPASVAAKVLLLNRLVATNTSNADLARLLNTRPQEAQRIVSLSHSTKIDTIQRALSALGQRLDIVTRSI
ncbi:type II toxin-antitoxin system HicB family antitoxin [Salmonella enterica subsp. enterica]|uniref:type II toxin-antitoxin system HicB family antitoxin n=1 Tax=Salmonella enterica TaxID=28901 RepID=UPI0012C33660|nr:type II toxin-antitoxin system HicB family antitoxin [Salmonella enterica]EBG6922917.1 type II toxin-antitoxin system HicB family antitoxin [Salmonella enterica subsp. enterica]EBW9496414.1 type II toxin-antitoxin system HicB family antitoxin [Salmonella enterica subsp. enterica serovar Brandenburg]ECB7382923.1 type II toxin-antitoxin system HicB family antitoxin [Salmonella enterica subsp. enterica serovar Brandenburg]ECN6005706.1 type II toxin-antitoxin system HicB family antitoxin [Salmon